MAQDPEVDDLQNIFLQVVVRDSEMTIGCGQGHQTFKWLANVAKAKYAKLHPQFKANQFTAINVYSSNCPLYPNEIIQNSVRPNEKIFVELLGPKIGANDPGFTRQKSMWELLAYSPKNDYVHVIFCLRQEHVPDLDESNPPRLIGNFGTHTWFVPMNVKRSESGNWEYEQSVPANAEVYFLWLVNGAPFVSKDYEIVVDNANQEMNCLHSGPPESNYSALRLPEITSEKYYKRNQKNAHEGPTRQVHHTKVGKMQLVTDLSTEQKDKMFNTDWRKMKLQDVLPHERDREKARKKLREFYDEIRTIFRYYSRHSHNTMYMNILTFMCFCSQCKIPDKDKLSKARLTELFHRVNLEYDIDTDLNVIYMSDPLNPDSMFTRAEFMESLVRMALIKYDSQPIDFGVVSMMDNHIRKHVSVPKEKGVRHAMTTETVHRMFLLYDHRLWTLFMKYATNDTNVMLPKAWENLLQDKNMFSHNFSIRAANHCYALSQQEDTEGDESDLMEMTFPEFCEAIARVAEKIYSDRPQGQRSRLYQKIEDLCVKLFPEPRNFRVKKKRVTLGPVTEKAFYKE